MAVYKRDIVDINLETGNIHRSFLKHSIGYKDQKADHFGIRTYRDGVPVDLTGVSVQGIFLPPQGDPIAITSGNIVDVNVAEVVLPQACYNYDGQFTLSIKLVDSNNSVTGTMRIVDGMVDNTHASGTVAPTSAVPTYQEILATYDAMVAATAAANGAIAATYSSSSTYKVGDYCIHDGGLYRCTTAITTAEAWTSGHWTAAKIGPDVSDLKSALLNENYNANYSDGYFENNLDMCINGSNGKWVLSGSTSHVIIPVTAGDIFKVLANDNQNTAYAVLTAYEKPIANALAHFSSVAGFTGVVTVTKGTVSDFVVPNDGNYLYLLKSYSGNNRLPSAVHHNGIDIRKGIRVTYETNNIENKQNVIISNKELQKVSGKVIPVFCYGYYKDNIEPIIVYSNKYVTSEIIHLNVGDVVKSTDTTNARVIVGKVVNGVITSELLNGTKTIDADGDYYITLRKNDSSVITSIEWIVQYLSIQRGNGIAGEIEEISADIVEIGNRFDAEAIRDYQLSLCEYPISVTKNASWSINDNRYWSAGNRIATENIPVAKGMKLCLYRGTFQYQVALYAMEVSAENIVYSTSDWTSDTYYKYIDIASDGYIVIWFRKNASNPDIVPSDFDGDIKLINMNGLRLMPEQYAIDRAMAVSDSKTYTVGDGTGLVYDDSRGMVYMIYNTSEDDYGESHDIIALAIFPVDQPWRAVYKEVARVGSVFGNETVSELREENILFISSSQIRIFLYISTNSIGLSYRYIDYNPVTDTFGTLERCYIMLDGVEKPITAYDIRNYVQANDGTFNAIELVIPTKINAYSNVIYTTICPGARGSLTGDDGGNVVFITSDDYGATFEAKCIIPTICMYEAGTAIDSNGLIYVLPRPTSQNSDTDAAKKIWISSDNGVTFVAYDFYRTSTTRPVLITYKGKILALSSDYDGVTRIPNKSGTNKPFTDRNRNNLYMRLGSGTNKADFITKFAFKSQHEITYYSPIIVDDTIYIAYLTNDLYGKTRGSKNIIKFTRIGEFYTDGQPTDWTL